MSSDFSPVSPSGFETELGKLADDSDLDAHAALDAEADDAHGAKTYTDTVASEVATDVALHDAGDGYYLRPEGRPASDLTMPQDRLYAVLLPSRAKHTVTQVGVRVSTAGAGGTVIRFGLFAHTAGRPGALIADLGTVAADSTGGVTLGSFAHAVDGPVWVGAVAQGGSPELTAIEGSPPIPVSSGFSSSVVGVDRWIYPHADSVSGALPDPWPGGDGLGDHVDSAPLVGIRVEIP